MRHSEKQISSSRAASKKGERLSGKSPALDKAPPGKKSGLPQSTVSASTGAIISPAIDFLCCGGLSIFVVIGIFVYALGSPQSQFIAQGLPIITGLILGTFVNAPHFMASYLLLYRNRTQLAQHRGAAIYVPLILVAVIIFAFLTPDPAANNPRINNTVLELLIIVSAVLLAWHYTGQAWGMTGAFAYIGGIRMDKLERGLVRCGYYALLVWHFLWACLYILQNPDTAIVKNLLDQLPYVVTAYNVWSGVVLLTIPVGIFGFIRIRRRTGIMPPLRCYAPWFAIYLWYALIWAHPTMFPLLQIFHALQYLVFPLRVEINQYAARKERTQARRLLHGILYYALLVLVGLAVFELPTVPLLLGNGIPNFLAVTSLNLLAVTTSFVNIHHYFIDGAIWKIRNPDVRKDLFAHLKTA